MPTWSTWSIRTGRRRIRRSPSRRWPRTAASSVLRSIARNPPRTRTRGDPDPHAGARSAMISRLQIEWPDPTGLRRPRRASDPVPRRLGRRRSRRSSRRPTARPSGTSTGSSAAGDLEPEWLAFLADSFNTPLVYVRGNHDRDGQWRDRPLLVPTWLERRPDRAAGRVSRSSGSSGPAWTRATTGDGRGSPGGRRSGSPGG